MKQRGSYEDSSGLMKLQTIAGHHGKGGGDKERQSILALEGPFFILMYIVLQPLICIPAIILLVVKKAIRELSGWRCARFIMTLGNLKEPLTETKNTDCLISLLSYGLLA